MSQTESMAAPSQSRRGARPEWISLTQAARMGGVSLGQCKLILDAAKVKRRLLPGQSWTRYLRSDVEAMFDEAVTTGPA